MAPYILLGHQGKRITTTKGKDPAVVVIMQKQVQNHVRIPGANQRFIWRIVSALDAIELVILQTGRIERFFSGNDIP